MALRDDAPYLQSRAALREIYGPRRIDGRAPQSARDSTPSGRMRYLEQSGEAKARGMSAKKIVESEFYDNFKPRQSPLESLYGGNYFAPGTNSPAYIARDLARGRTSGSYETPYGPVSFSTAPNPAQLAAPSPAAAITPLSFNLNTPSPLGASALAGFMPTQPQTYTPPWRKPSTPFMGSIYKGASRWLGNA